MKAVLKGSLGCLSCRENLTSALEVMKSEVEFTRQPQRKSYYKLTNAVFTLGKNMFSLIMNETCFTIQIAHIRSGGAFTARIVMKTCLF